MTEKGRRTLKIKYKNIIFCILLLIISISIFYLVYAEYNKQQEQKAFEVLQEEQRKEEEELRKQKELEERRNKELEKKQQQLVMQEVGKQEEVIEEPTVLLEYKELYEENSDLYGWIKIEDTVVDYPVMHTPDRPNYYTDKNWEKEQSKSGTPHIDARTKIDETENTIIYAHHMKNGTMFGSLEDYKDISYYENHKYIEFNTIYEKEKYEIVSVSKAVVYYDGKTDKISEPPEGTFEFYNYIELDTYEKFYEYIDKARENEYYPTGVTAKYGDKLITLCTCDYWTTNARLLVIAKKIE